MVDDKFNYVSTSEEFSVEAENLKEESVKEIAEAQEAEEAKEEKTLDTSDRNTESQQEYNKIFRHRANL